MRPWWIGCCVLALGAVTAPLAAQEAVGTQTAIVADTLPSLSTGTIATTEGAVTTIGGGVRAGDNLFHSFARFNLSPGDIARWTASDAPTIRNVINRVTGGEQSFIAGTIDASAMPGADFYFINPAGIVFGDGAAIDVGGTAHFSTAQTLGFADGSVLVSGTASGSTFSMAEPARFGFLGNNQPISVSGPPEALTVGQTAGRLSLTASDISLFSTEMAVDSLALRAVGQGALSLAVGPDTAAMPAGGMIDIFASIIGTSSGGRVTMSADNVQVSGRSLVLVTARDSASPAIHVRANRLTIDSGTLQVNAITGLAARGGDITLDASFIGIGQDGTVAIGSQPQGGGGTITLNAHHVLLNGGNIEARGAA